MCLTYKFTNKQLKRRWVINQRLIRKSTIPQSASLTAPFTQGSRGLRKGRFQPLYKVGGAEQKHIFVFYEGTETKQKILYFPTLEIKSNRPCTFKPPLCKGRWADYNLKCNTAKKERQHANHSVECSYHTTSNTR